MGVCCSKHGNIHRNTSEGVGSERGGSIKPEEDELLVDSPNKYDKDAIAALKAEFRDDVETFILNQMLMSIMFFENYDKERELLANTVSEWDRNFNKDLINYHQKQCLMPDVIFENVSRRVRFRPIHGPKKGVSEPLVAQRLYIVHDNIEVLDTEADYTGIDKPTYRATTEKCEKHEGYIKLRHLKLSSKSSLSDDNEDSEKQENILSEPMRIYQKEDEIVSQPNAFSSFDYNREDSQIDFDAFTNVPSTSSGVRYPDSGVSTAVNSESSYGYARITEATTPTPLNILEPNVYTNISELPEDCISPVKVKNQIEFFDDDDVDESDDETRTRKPVNPSELFVTKYYFKSSKFMTHFKNNVFPNTLGEVMGFPFETIERSTTATGTVYSDTLDEMGNLVQCEIIPAVFIPWPSELAWEWPSRKRTVVIDRRTTYRYRWPTDNMIQDVQRFQCVAIPKGFLPKRNRNPEQDIQWEVAFPKAEKYLETRMSHAQIRTYLFILAVYKTFIEPVTDKHGLLPEHIRNHMFWEIESNYRSWPETRLGAKIKIVLKNFYDLLKKSHMSDYFITGKNVFENVPGKYLRPPQETIFRILESPVPYFLIALRNLRYMSGKFYPAPDFKKLYDILTQGFKKIHPNLYHDTLLRVENTLGTDRRRKDRSDKEREWQKRLIEKYQHEKINKEKLKREKQKNLNTEKKVSADSVNLELSFSKGIESVVQRELLIFFIQHFIEIAKKSSKLATPNQTMLYLKQAWYLTKLLEDIGSAFDEDVALYQNQINKEEEVCKKKSATIASIPSTPKRNSTQFQYHYNEIHVKSNTINVVNLNESYNATSIHNEVKSVTPGAYRKINLKLRHKESGSDVHANSVKSKNSTISVDLGNRVNLNADVHEIRDKDNDKTDSVQEFKLNNLKRIDKKSVAFDIETLADPETESTSL